jgi:thiol:disulfide interchange protein DsbC
MPDNIHSSMNTSLSRRMPSNTGIISALLISANLFLQVALAVEPGAPVEPAVPAHLAEAIKRSAPEVAVDRIRPAPIPGLFEIVSGKSIFYVDGTGRYFVSGQIFDMQERKNLSAAAASDLIHIDPNSLVLDDAIKIVRGTGKRQIYVFTDPDCPYCKKLEREGLADVKDVTIHIFLFPLVQLHPDARNKAVKLWCAANPVQAWEDLMRRDAVPPAREGDECAHPVDRNLALGNKVGIEATPTLVFADGHVIAGAASTQDIEARLSVAH